MPKTHDINRRLIIRAKLEHWDTAVRLAQKFLAEYGDKESQKDCIYSTTFVDGTEITMYIRKNKSSVSVIQAQ